MTRIKTWNDCANWRWTLWWENVKRKKHEIKFSVFFHSFILFALSPFKLMCRFNSKEWSPQRFNSFYWLYFEMGKLASSIDHWTTGRARENMENAFTFCNWHFHAFQCINLILFYVLQIIWIIWIYYVQFGQYFMNCVKHLKLISMAAFSSFFFCDFMQSIITLYNKQ